MDQFKSLLYLTPSLYILKVSRLPGVRSKLPSLQADRRFSQDSVVETAARLSMLPISLGTSTNRRIVELFGMPFLPRQFVPGPMCSPPWTATVSSLEPLEVFGRPTSSQPLSPLHLPHSYQRRGLLQNLLSLSDYHTDLYSNHPTSAPSATPSSAPTYKPRDCDDLHHLRDDEGRGADRENSKGNGKESDL